MNKQTVTIKTNKENPEPAEIIAQAIIDVATAFEKMNKSRLTQRAIIVLVKDRIKHVSLPDIEAVLDAVPKLKDYYIKKIPDQKKK